MPIEVVRAVKIDGYHAVKEFEAGLPEGHSLRRSNEIWGNLYEIVREIPDPSPFQESGDIWTAENREATEKERAELATLRDRALEALQALQAESDKLPTLIDRAIEDGDSQALQTHLQRKAAIAADVGLAELKYFQARLRWQFAERSFRLAERNRLRLACIEISEATAKGDPKRRETCGRYYDLRGGVDLGIADTRRRIDQLLSGLRG